MGLALEQAEKARALGEVPVGCVIVKDGKDRCGIGGTCREEALKGTEHALKVVKTRRKYIFLIYTNISTT